MRFLYNLAAILIVTIIIPIFMLRATRERGFVERIKQSFGFYPQETIDKVAGKNAIWVHAASVGEIVATSPLVREFRTASLRMRTQSSTSRSICPSSLHALWGASVRAYSCPWRRSFGRTFSRRQNNWMFRS